MFREKEYCFYSQDLLEVGIDEIKLSCLGLLQIAPTISMYVWSRKILQLPTLNSTRVLCSMVHL